MCQPIRRQCLNMLFVSVLVTGFALLAGCGGGSDPATSPVTYDAFGAPQLVTITGYAEDIAEPFFSRDEQYLFFNDNSAGKNLHYATYSGALIDEFIYGGEVGPGINDGSTVQGVPTMDDNYIFYFVDTKFYAPLDVPPVFDTLFTGTWTGMEEVTGVGPVVDIAFPSPGLLNFDLEISPDGNTLYFVDGFFSGGPVPELADIKLANFNSGTGLFERDSNADAIMANITTSDREYAPAISRDGLELFFTRLDTNLDARIYRTTRVNTADIFSPPQLVSAIPGFAEGATFSQDEKTIYYHWHNTLTNKFELYRVVRP